MSERVAETPVWEMEGNEASEGGSVNETTVSPEGGKLTGKGEEGCGEDPRRTMREAEESVVRVEGDVSARRWTVSPGPYPPSLLPSLVVVEEEEEEEEEEGAKKQNVEKRKEEDDDQSDDSEDDDEHSHAHHRRRRRRRADDDGHHHHRHHKDGDGEASGDGDDDDGSSWTYSYYSGSSRSGYESFDEDEDPRHRSSEAADRMPEQVQQDLKKLREDVRKGSTSMPPPVTREKSLKDLRSEMSSLRDILNGIKGASK